MSADGTRMIGHVILQKSFDGEDLIQVSGGRLLANGSRGAVVEAVKSGSIAELEGHILPGEYHHIQFLHGHYYFPYNHKNISKISLVERRAFP